jgi:hypothetical protein
MALIRDELIEAEARAMMPATIEKSGWYPSLQGAARARRIDQDVDLQWHLLVPTVRERLERERTTGSVEPKEGMQRT